MSISHDGGNVNVDYKLMPLTTEESIAGGEFLGRRYALEHKERWIDLNDQIFNMQTYDRGYTRIHVNGRTYQIYQDFADSDMNIRLFIGKYAGTAEDDPVGGILTMDMTPRNIFTWKDLKDMGVVNDSANLVIHYSKLFDENHCLIGNSYSGGVCLVIPAKTTSGDAIVDVSADDAETEWVKANYPAKYICKVVLPEGLTTIGKSGPAFPMLGRNIVRHEISVKIPSTVTTIGQKAFYGSKLQTLSGSKLREFTLSDKLETIDESAFENCSELTTIHFGKSLKTVKAKAFSGCRKCQIYFRNTIETVAEDACFLVGDVEYTPRVKEGEPMPDVVTNAPFKAKLWNGKVGYTIGFYKKPTMPKPDNPPILPGGDSGSTDPDRVPLDLSEVLQQATALNTTADNIATPT